MCSLAGDGMLLPDIQINPTRDPMGGRWGWLADPQAGAAGSPMGAAMGPRWLAGPLAAGARDLIRVNRLAGREWDALACQINSARGPMRGR